jgi:hypothetical protein
MGTVGECRLCQTHGELRLSHIIPKFVFRFQRDGSVSPLRSHLVPDRPVQDSRKIYFLCDECEERFSAWETAFKREVYDPFHTGSLGSLGYGPWLLKFAASLAWRTLRATIETEIATPPAIKFATATIEAEEIWRDFLLDKSEHPGDYPLYLFLLESLAKTSDTTVPINFAFYIHRVAAAGIWHDPPRQSLFTFSMICSIAVIGVISLRNARRWGERLHVRSGALKITSRTPPSEVIDMIKAQANEHLKMSRQLSERQKTLDQEAFSKDEDKTVESGYLQAMAFDVARATKGDPQALGKLSRAVVRAARNKRQ